MTDNEKTGAGVFGQLGSFMESAKQLQKNIGECYTCKKPISPGGWHVSIPDMESGDVYKICQDCNFKATMRYVKEYKEKLKGK